MNSFTSSTAAVQCCRFRRYIGQFTPKIEYLYWIEKKIGSKYLKNILVDSKYKFTADVISLGILFSRWINEVALYVIVNPGYNKSFYTLANGSLYPGIRYKGRDFNWIRQDGA